MSHHKLFPLALVLALFSYHQALAQQVPELSGPFGGLVTPDILGTPTDTAAFADDPTADADAARWVFSFVPSFTSTEGASLYGGTVQGGFKKLQLDLRYLHVDPDGGDSLNQLRGQVKYSLITTDQGLQLSAVGSYTDLEDLFDQVDLGLSVAQKLTQRLTVFADVRHIDRSLDAGSSIDDIGTTVGMRSLLRATQGRAIILALDYSLENDFSDSDNYSGALTVQFNQKRSLTFGAAKDDVYFALLGLVL